MERRRLAFWLSFLLAGWVCAEEPVCFVDGKLKTAVEEALWICDPTPTDMLALTCLDVDNRGIQSVAGLEYAANLETLIIRWNHITDLSPLSGLTNLRELDAHNNGLSDISALAGLVNLRRLVLRINHIGSISALSGIVCLEELHLEWNDISDLSPLSGLPLLASADLRNNRITDISPLLGMPSLRSVDLQGNPLSETSREVYIPQILALMPGINLLYDEYARMYVLRLSTSPGGSVTFPGTGTLIYESGTSVRLEATANPGFRFAHWSGSCPGTSNPKVITMDQDYDIRADFVSLLDTIHVDDDGTGDQLPQNPTASDPAEDGSVKHPFDRIQEAIDVAADGATVLVHSGVYGESIDFLGKGIEVIGDDPEPPNDMAWPVIEGVPGQPVVSVMDGGDAECLLRGLVITGGDDRVAGGIRCVASRLAIANCLIVGNRAGEPNSAVVYCVDSDAVLANCTIADNRLGAQGAVLRSVDSHVTVVNSILWGDLPKGIIEIGAGGVFANYSIIVGGWAGAGNTDADPLFTAVGHWTDPDDPEAVLGPGDAGAIWVIGDYHVQSQAGRWDSEAGHWQRDKAMSPCIDAGDPATPVGSELSPNGGIINLGVYGGTAEASKSRLEALSSQATVTGSPIE